VELDLGSDTEEKGGTEGGSYF
jgi:hypothetical protein